MDELAGVTKAELFLPESTLRVVDRNAVGCLHAGSVWKIGNVKKDTGSNTCLLCSCSFFCLFFTYYMFKHVFKHRHGFVITYRTYCLFFSPQSNFILLYLYFYCSFYFFQSFNKLSVLEVKVV